MEFHSQKYLRKVRSSRVGDEKIQCACEDGEGMLLLAIHNRFQSRESPKSCRALQCYNSQGDWARELSKPSTDWASLVVKIETKSFSFSVGGFLEVMSQRGHVLEILATFAQPWAPTHWPTFLAQSFVEN